MSILLKGFFLKWLNFIVTWKNSTYCQFLRNWRNCLLHSLPQFQNIPQGDSNEVAHNLVVTGHYEQTHNLTAWQNPQVVISARGGLQAHLVHPPVPLAPPSPVCSCLSLLLLAEPTVVIPLFQTVRTCQKTCHSAIFVAASSRFAWFWPFTLEWSLF